MEQPNKQTAVNLDPDKLIEWKELTPDGPKRIQKRLADMTRIDWIAAHTWQLAEIEARQARIEDLRLKIGRHLGG